MEIKLQWKYASGMHDTKTMKLDAIEALSSKREKDAAIAIRDSGCCIASIHLGDSGSSNKLAAEIVRRFNEFPEELKR